MKYYRRFVILAMPNKKKTGFRCVSRPIVTSRVQKPKVKRKQWTEIQMLTAISSVQNDGLSGNQAADHHRVPRSTLKDQLSGRVIHGTKSGPKIYLSADEENELEKYLLQGSKIGYGKTRCDIKCIVERYLKENGRMRGPSLSDGWWTKFIQKHPNLHLHSGDSPAGVRIDAVNADNLRAYYALLRGVYDEHESVPLPSSVTPPVSESAPPSVGPPMPSLLGSAAPSMPSLLSSAAPSSSPIPGSAAPSSSSLLGKSRPLSGIATSTPSLANCSPFLKLLNLPSTSTPVMPKTGRACVLTSSECLKLVKEKEEKRGKLR